MSWSRTHHYSFLYHTQQKDINDSKKYTVIDPNIKEPQIPAILGNHKRNQDLLTNYFHTNISNTEAKFFQMDKDYTEAQIRSYLNSDQRNIVKDMILKHGNNISSLEYQAEAALKFNSFMEENKLETKFIPINPNNKSPYTILFNGTGDEVATLKGNMTKNKWVEDFLSKTKNSWCILDGGGRERNWLVMSRDNNGKKDENDEYVTIGYDDQGNIISNTGTHNHMATEVTGISPYIPGNTDYFFSNEWLSENIPYNEETKNLKITNETPTIDAILRNEQWDIEQYKKGNFKYWNGDIYDLPEEYHLQAIKIAPNNWNGDLAFLLDEDQLEALEIAHDKWNGNLASLPDEVQLKALKLAPNNWDGSLWDLPEENRQEALKLSSTNWNSKLNTLPEKDRLEAIKTHLDKWNGNLQLLPEKDRLEALKLAPTKWNGDLQLLPEEDRLEAIKLAPTKWNGDFYGLPYNNDRLQALKLSSTNWNGNLSDLPEEDRLEALKLAKDKWNGNLYSLPAKDRQEALEIAHDKWNGDLSPLPEKDRLKILETYPHDWNGDLWPLSYNQQKKASKFVNANREAKILKYEAKILKYFGLRKKYNK